MLTFGWHWGLGVFARQIGHACQAAGEQQLWDVVPSCSWQLLQEQCDAGCHMLLLCFFQPLCLQLPSRKWLSGSQLVSSMCEVIDKYAKDFSRVRKPVFMVRLLQGVFQMAACL